jgi:HEAT repeat protein
VDRLIDALANHSDGPTRMSAARVLGDLKAREAVTALSHGLLDEDQFVRAAAAYALADIADPDALAILRRALIEVDESTKHEAVGGYGSTRSHVAEALSKMHTDGAFAALAAAVRRDPCDRDVIIAVANSFDPRAIPALEAIAANRDVPHDLHETVTQALRSLTRFNE